jgi:SET domain-containing protein
MATKTRLKKKRPAKAARSTTKKAKAKKRARPSPPGRAGPVNKWMELRDSGIHGLGGFAIRDIPKGTRVIEYAGERVNNAEADRRYDDDKMKEHHTFLFILSTRTCVDAAFEGNEARFLNHSCDPNCETSVSNSRIWISSIKRIPAGTELTYDYQYDYEPHYTEKDLRFYGCECGSPKCRGTIVMTDKLKKMKEK